MRDSCSSRARHLRGLMDRLAASLIADGVPRADDGAGGCDGTLLYLGSIHDAVPRSLLFDPLLGAIDIVTWQAIRIHAGDRCAARFPGYADLAEVVKVSRPTLGRAIMTLRIVRWLSVLSVIRRDEQGRITLQQRIYALHDERIPVGDAIYLDADYVELVVQCCNHRHPPLARIARAIRQQLGQAGGEALVEQSAEVPLSVAWIKDFAAGVSPAEDNFIPALDDSGNQNISRRNGGNHFKSSEIQLVSESAHTTTTTTSWVSPEENRASEGPASIIAGQGCLAEWPEPLLAFLDYDERIIGVLEQRLDALGVDEAQALLDEAAGALAAKMHRGEPIDNPPGYVLALIRRAVNRQFTPTFYRQAGRAMRFERGPVSFDRIFAGESAAALVYARSGKLLSPGALPSRSGVSQGTSDADG